MAFVRITHTGAHGTSGGGAAGTSPAVDTTGANLIVICIANFAGQALTTDIIDSKSNTYVQLPTGAAINGNEISQIFYCLNPTVGTGHTFSPVHSGVIRAYTVIAYSGAASPTVLDLTNKATGSGGSPQFGSVSPTNNNSLVISGGIFDSTVSAIDSSFAIVENQATGSPRTCAIAELIQTTKGAVNPTWTSGGSVFAGINAVFISATGGLTETLADSLSISDALANIISIENLLSDSLSLSDTLTVNVPIQAINLSDSLNLSDQAQLMYGLILSEGFTLSDLFAFGLSLPLVISTGDSISLSDAVVYLIGIGIGRSDVLSFSDVLNIAGVVTKILETSQDNILLSDFLAILIQYLPTYSDAFSLADSTKLNLSLGISSTDSLLLTDAVVLAIVNNLTLVKSDSLNLSDSLQINSSGPLDSYIRHYLNDVPR